MADTWAHVALSVSPDQINFFVNGRTVGHDNIGWGLGWDIGWATMPQDNLILGDITDLGGSRCEGRAGLKR